MFTRLSPRIVPLALVAAVVATAFQTAAFAGVPQEPNGRTVEVTARGLDLATPDGRTALDDRIKQAARTVCTPADFRDLNAFANRAACQAAAVAAAKGQRDLLVARAEQRQQLAAARTGNGVN